MTSGAPAPPRARIIGAGRAGGSFSRALSSIGWDVGTLLTRRDPVSRAAAGVDLLLITTPDAAVAAVAAAVEPVAGTLVAHAAGSLTLDVLRPHVRRGSLHPLVPLPDARTGARRLTGGSWFAVGGSDADDVTLLRGIVDGFGGRSVAVADQDRARYHAAACIAANHLVALLGQVDRVAGSVGVPLEAYLALARASLDDVASVGPAAALTGPVARRDWPTVAHHLEALPAIERDAYRALALAAHRLVATAGDPADEPPAVLST